MVSTRHSVAPGSILEQVMERGQVMHKHITCHVTKLSLKTLHTIVIDPKTALDNQFLKIDWPFGDKKQEYHSLGKLSGFSRIN